ncbi:uncharacterized protein LOC125101181 [Lutra lutra]|uniref:uncharacterized protein LOC125101181 n=1 Tax=Lutra lutra TaxID=9657 RepID=UPI001FD1EFC5|nr:uncharacterized protein LOC125101181 [Lutra lutra]
MPPVLRRTTNSTYVNAPGLQRLRTQISIPDAEPSITFATLFNTLAIRVRATRNYMPNKFQDIPPPRACPHEACVLGTPARPCAGWCATWANNPGRPALGAAKCEAERQPTPVKRRFGRRTETHPSPARLPDSQKLAREPASRTRGDPSGDCQRLHGAGGQRRPPRSPPGEQFPDLRPSRSSGLRGEHTPAGRAAGVSRGGRNRSGAAGETYGGVDRRQARPAAFSPRSPRGRR